MSQAITSSMPNPSSQDLLKDLRELVGVFRRGWRYIALSIAISLTMAAIYLAKTSRQYQATARVLVVHQGGRPLNVSNNDATSSVGTTEDVVPTHAVVLSSPIVVRRAIELVGLEALPSLKGEENPVKAAVKNLKITRPDRTAKILQIDYRARTPWEATRMVEALTDSYQKFLDETFQKNNGEVVQLIMKARDELSNELDDLEKKYLKFHQNNPLLATDSGGRTLVARRLDEWDRVSSEALVRSVQLKSQLALGRQLAEQGLGATAILQSLNQLGGGASDLRSLAGGEANNVASGYLGQLVQEQQQLAEKFGPDYAKVKSLQDQITRVQQRTREARGGAEKLEVQELLAALEESIKTIEVMRAEYGKQFLAEREEARRSETDRLTEQNLRQGLERNRSLFNTVVDQLKEAQFVSDFSAVSAQLIEPANALPSAVHPRLSLTLALALLAGGMLGAGGAYASDRLDPRIRTVDGLRKVLDFHVLGQIPQVPTEQMDTLGEYGLVGHLMPRSMWSESYRAVRTNVEFLRRNRRIQVVLVASPHSGDGKSVSASNLAISMAMAGRKVLLVDGDLRKPSQHKIHNLNNDCGLGNLLRDGIPAVQVFRRTSVENLDLVSAGADIQNPAELLSSARMAEFLDEARASYDLVIVDSSPLLAVTDASILSSLCDGIILVVRANTLRHREAEIIRDLLGTLGNPVLGTLINGIGREHGSYGYGYGYGGAYGTPYGSTNGIEARASRAVGLLREPSNNGNGHSGRLESDLLQP